MDTIKDAVLDRTCRAKGTRSNAPEAEGDLINSVVHPPLPGSVGDEARREGYNAPGRILGADHSR